MTNIPQELIDCPQWICHKAKVPKSPSTGRNLSGSMNEWGVPFDKAKKALEKYGFDGLGFVFKSDGPYCGIDLDKCVINGDISPDAKAIMDACNSYSEYSISKTGIHIIVRNTSGTKISLKKNGVEAYSCNKYFTVSGFGINGKGINEVDVPRMLDSYFNKSGEFALDNAESIVKRISESGNGEKFLKLWSGDWKGGYGSQSEADMALCSILAFWVENGEQVDKLFRMSKLFREKWDRSVGQGKTYGQLTIEKVMAQKETVNLSSSVVVELDDFKVLKMPEIKTIMHPWLTYGSTHMVYAPRGAGKTFFSMSISLAVAYGTDFGDWMLKEPENVLYVDGEMLPQTMIKRAKGLEVNLKTKQKKWYILSSGINLQNKSSAINIAKPYWQEYIFNEVVTKNIKLLFLDNISALTPGIEENESSSWDNIAAWQNKLKQTGCAVVLVHHAGKSGQQRGTSAREDALDTVISLRPVSKLAESGVDVDVVFEKSRHISGVQASAMNFKIISDPGSDNLKWEMGNSGVSKRNEVIKLLVQGMGYREISDRVGLSRNTLSKYKQQAMDKGWVQKSDNGTILTKLGETIINGGECEF